jgi:hypothetical protein
MQVTIQDFIIREASVVCPSCYTPFATPQLADMPDLTPQTVVEADLHRVLPDAAIRGALIAICPACIYTWWSTAFAAHFFVPQMLVPSPAIESAKKFAHAVLTGRKNGAHALDRALLALNGCWCSRETYASLGDDKAEEAQAENIKWMKLAVQELEEALNDDSWNGNRSRYSYMMGEMLRQLGDFHKAVKYLDLVDRKSMLPFELIRHQREMAVNGQSEPVQLPPHLVEQIFMPKPLIDPEEVAAPDAAAMVVPVSNASAI